jgi:hypothetical protein
MHLRANQLGYRPADAKEGIAFGTEPLPPTFGVVEAGSGAEVFRGTARSLQQGAWGRFVYHAKLDFSDVTQPGRYQLRLGTDRSLPFYVDEAVFRPLPEQLLEFMRQQRCGFNPWLGVVCHDQDGRTAFGPLPSGTVLDARGGWHDAADLLKYLLTSGNATAQMLLAWHLTAAPASSAGASPWLDRVNALGQDGTNGVPDLLDEARWGLEWMLKLHPAPAQLYHQVADDRDHVGWRLPQNEIADYGWGKGGARVVYAAEGKPQGLGKYQSDSTGLGNLAGRYAAALALAAQTWGEPPRRVAGSPPATGPRDAAFARRCLTAAIEVYRLGRAKEGVQQGNSYGAPYRYAETTWADDMEWGAAELFRATGDASYLEDAKRYAQLALGQTWMGREETGHYQYYPFVNVGHFRLHALADADLRRRLEADYREGMDRCRAAGERNPYGVGVPFIWCSNNLLVGLVTQSAFYERMTGRRQAGFIGRHRDWLLGCNPWGTTMFTQIGQVFPRNVHLMTTRLTGRSVRGGLVDGPVRARIFRSLKGVSISEPNPLAIFQDDRAVYHDDLMDYATNEPTMDGTASAVLMWTLLNGS